MSSNSLEQRRALLSMCRILFDRNNLIGTDLHDIAVKVTDVDFGQSKGGVRIEFSVSYHAIGKLDNGELSDALDVLLPNNEPHR